MTTVEPGAGAGLVDRVKNILIQPRAEWERIATENTSFPALLTGYVLPLSAIAAVCGFVGMTFIGIGGLFGYSVHMPLLLGVFTAVYQIVMSLVGVWLVGLLINALAPTFGSEPNQIRANQLIAYASTAGFVGGFIMLIPMLGIVALIGSIYSLVLLYIGLPHMMKTPEDKRLPYFVTIIVVALVVGIVAAAVLTPLRMAIGGFGFGGPMAPPWAQHQAASTPGGGTLTLPNGQSVNTSDLERAAKQLEAMNANPQAVASAAAINAEQLKTLLPDALPGGFTRTEISTGSSGAMMGVSTASAVYTRGESRIDLSVTDMGAASAIAAMAGVFGAQGSRETADGYERTGPVDGRMTIEEVDRPNHSAKYGVLAAQRIMIEAHGAGITIDDVHGAVNAVGVARAEAMAQQTAATAAAAAPTTP